MSSWLDSEETQREIAEDRLFVDVVEHISEAMEIRGVTRADLALSCGVTRSEMTQRLSGARNLTLKVVASTLHALGFGLEIGLVDRQNENRVTRLRSYEDEWLVEHRANVIDITQYRTWCEPWAQGDGQEQREAKAWV